MRVIIPLLITFGTTAASAQAQVIVPPSDEVVPASSVLDAVHQDIMSVGQYYIHKDAVDAKHCAVDVSLRPISYELDYSQATNVDISGSVGGSILIVTAKGTLDHAIKTTFSSTAPIDLKWTDDQPARWLTFPKDQSDPRLSKSANQLRQQEEALVNLYVKTSHLLPCNQSLGDDVKPTLTSEVDVTDTGSATVSIAWVATVGLAPTSSRATVNKVKVTFSMQPFKYRWTDGQGHSQPGATSKNGLLEYGPTSVRQ